MTPSAAAPIYTYVYWLFSILLGGEFVNFRNRLWSPPRTAGNDDDGEESGRERIDIGGDVVVFVVDGKFY